MIRIKIIILITQLLNATFSSMSSMVSENLGRKRKYSTEAYRGDVREVPATDDLSESTPKTQLQHIQAIQNEPLDLSNSNPKFLKHQLHSDNPTNSCPLGQEGPLMIDRRPDISFASSPQQKTNTTSQVLGIDLLIERPVPESTDMAQSSSSPKIPKLLPKHVHNTHVFPVSPQRLNTSSTVFGSTPILPFPFYKQSLIPLTAYSPQFNHLPFSHLTPTRTENSPVSAKSSPHTSTLFDHDQPPQETFQSTSAIPSTSRFGDLSLPSNSRTPTSVGVETKQVKTFVNMRTKLSEPFTELLFLESSVPSDLAKPVELHGNRKARRNSVRIKCYLEKTVGPNLIYRVFLICKNFKNNYKTKGHDGKLSLEKVDTRVVNHIDSDDYFRNPKNRLELINDARMQLFVFREEPRLYTWLHQVHFNILKTDVYSAVSEKFLEYKDNKRSSQNGCWESFLKDYNHEKIAGFSYSEVLKGVELVSFFDIKYSGVANEKAKSNNGKYGSLDFDYNTIYLDILDEFGSRSLKSFGIKIKGSPIFLCHPNSTYYASQLTQSSFFVNVEFGEKL